MTGDEKPVEFWLKIKIKIVLKLLFFYHVYDLNNTGRNWEESYKASEHDHNREQILITFQKTKTKILFLTHSSNLSFKIFTFWFPNSNQLFPWLVKLSLSSFFFVKLSHWSWESTAKNSKFRWTWNLLIQTEWRKNFAKTKCKKIRNRLGLACKLKRESCRLSKILQFHQELTTN